MKQKILIISLLIFSPSLFSQTPDSIVLFQLQQKVGLLQTELKKQMNDFSSKIEMANDEIFKLRSEIENEKAIIASLADSLGKKIDNNLTSAEHQIADVDESYSKITLWIIIALLFAIIISVAGYLLLRKKHKSDMTNMITSLNKLKQTINEQLINEFIKNTEVLKSLSQIVNSSQTAEPDHSLAIKVASEINLIERNLSLMDSKTKGLKQLSRSMEKLKDNLAANGYEIPQLLGKEYNQGMKVIVVNSIPDENLEKGVEIISKILIPQVNFNGKMILAAQIEISVGY